MANRNKVVLQFAGDSSQLERTFDRVGGSAKTMGARVDTASRDTRRGFDRAAESADNFDTKSMGAANAINGVIDVTRAFNDTSLTGAERAALLAMGFSDIGSGLYNTVIPALGSAAKALRSTAVAQRILNFAMRMNPIGIVVAVIAALAAGLIYAYKKSATFRKIVDGAFRAIRDVVAKVVLFILDLIQKWLNAWLTLIEKMLRGIARFVGIFKPNWAKAMNNAADKVKGFREKARDDEFIKLVPSGVATVAELQSKGFAYVKVG